MDFDYHVKDILPHIIDCTRSLYANTPGSTTHQLQFIMNEVLYYLLPILLTIGVIFSIINTIVTAKMVVSSHECYLVAFNLSCSFLLTTACIFQLPNYVRQAANEYTLILPYLPAVESWCWYSCTWLLVTIVLERSVHGLCGKWHSSFSRLHGSLVSLLIMIICFVSTLPQYWEYKLIPYSDSFNTHNCTRDVLIPRDEVLQSTGGPYLKEYTWYHWYKMIISVGLPYLILPIIILPLVCIKMHIYTSMPTSNGKQSLKYNMGSSLKDQLKEERSFNRLIFTLTVLYLLMSGPRSLLQLMHNPPVSHRIDDNHLLMLTLQVLFDVLFYCFFCTLFFLFLAFGKKFKTTLYQLCCCKKSEPSEFYY